jgi:hypothetical protein
VIATMTGCSDDDPVPPGPDNNPPVANIDANPLTVPADDGNQTVVTLDGSASSDPDGDALTFAWNVPGGTFVGGTTASSEVAQVTFPGIDPYNVTLTVSDGRGGTAQANVTIGLGPPPPANRPPTASFTADPTDVREGDANRTTVTLDGSASSDPDGDDLTFSWDVPSGTFVNGTDAVSEAPQVTFPGTAPYVVTLTVDDGNGETDQVQATVGIIPNTPPQANIEADPTSVPPGDNNQTVVTLDGSGSSDGDGDALTYSWDVPSGTFVNGTDATSQVARVTFPGSAPYLVTLTVDDGFGGTDDAQVTIDLQQQANQPPTAVVSANPTSVPAGDGNNTVVTIDASQSSDPDGDSLTFSWVVPSGTFVNGTGPADPTIQVTFPGAAPYTVRVTVDDGNGGSDEASVTITLG